MKRAHHELLSRAVVSSGLLAKGDTLVVGASSGPDSMALLEVLSLLAPKYCWKIHAVHLNHMLRGKDSDADEKFLRSWATQREISFSSQRTDVAAYSKRNRLSLEDAARRCRYSLLEKVAQDIGADKIVLAHTADDQAETLLWRLVRGSVTGLAGMPAKRPCAAGNVWVVRPFLSVRKHDILAFLREKGIRYRVDESNKETQFTRNRIRNNLIPYLEKNFNPALIPILNATAQSLGHQKDLIDSWTQKILRGGMIRDRAGRKFVDVKSLCRLPVALKAEVLKKAFESAGGDLAAIKNVHIQKFIALTKPLPSSKQVLIGPIRVRREQKAVVFSPIKPAPTDCTPTTLPIPGRTTFAGGTVQTALSLRKNKLSAFTGNAAIGVYQEHVDWDSLVGPLRLRMRRPQDRYQPIGLEGTKKVKDILMEMKIPLSLRDHYPVLEDAAGKIFWLVGYRIAEFCKVRPSTRTILCLRLELSGIESPKKI